MQKQNKTLKAIALKSMAVAALCGGSLLGFSHNAMAQDFKGGSMTVSEGNNGTEITIKTKNGSTIRVRVSESGASNVNNTSSSGENTNTTTGRDGDQTTTTNANENLD